MNRIRKLIRNAVLITGLAALALPVCSPPTEAATLSNLTIYTGKTSAILYSGVINTNGASCCVNMWAIWATNAWASSNTMTNNPATYFTTATNYNVTVGSATSWVLGGLGECSNYTALVIGFEPGMTSNTFAGGSTFGNPITWTNACGLGVNAGNVESNAPFAYNGITVGGTNYTLSVGLCSNFTGGGVSLGTNHFLMLNH